MKILDQAEGLQFECLASAPTPASIARIYWDTTLGYPLIYNGSAWAALPLGNPTSTKQYLANSGFDIQTRGLSTCPSGSRRFIFDRWYTKNSLGTNGVITTSSIAGSQPGNTFAAKVQITTAPTAAQTNGTEMYQTIENLLAQELIVNGNASFSAKIKAFGNVNQVGIAFMYNTGQAKAETIVGVETVVSVNTSGYVTGQIVGQALSVGTITASGTVGVRIRIVGVSTGNTYDVNNGFAIEQPKLNAGLIPLSWSRFGGNFADDLLYCQRFCEASYDFNVVPGTVTGVGSALFYATASTYFSQFHYKVTKFVTPTLSFYSPTTGTVGKAYDVTGAAEISTSSQGNGLQNVIAGAAATTGHLITTHYLADAEI